MTKNKPAFERVAETLRKTAAENMKKVEKQRRQSKHADYLYDAYQDGFWDIRDGTFYSKPDSVNATIPLDEWRVITEDNVPVAGANEQAAEAGARRPRTRRIVERMVRPTDDLKRIENDHVVETSTWAPGLPQIIENLLPTDGGLTPERGVRVFNRYRPPSPLPLIVDRPEPQLWLELCERVIPNKKHREHLFDFMAHMVQCPAVKPNFGIVMIGEQGIGKDSMWLPVTHAVGSHNFRTIGPDDVLSASGFNPFIESILVVINEVRPAQEGHTQSQLYEKLKPYLAAPPMMLALNQKFVKVRYVVNVMRVVIFTNHRAAIFLTSGDRRMFVIESLLPRNWHIAAGLPNYFTDYYHWLEAGGYDDVRAWLEQRDISRFNPKATAMDTPVKKHIAALYESSNTILEGALGRIDYPDIAFGFQLIDATGFLPDDDDRKELKKLLRVPARVEHAAERSDYMLVHTDRLRVRVPGKDEQKEAKLALVKTSFGRSMADDDLQAAIRAAFIAAVAASAVGGHLLEGVDTQQGTA